jgi:hypothetical protein
MTKDVEVAVVCQYLETLVAQTIPLIENFLDFEDLSPGFVGKGEPEGAFICFVAGVTFDLETQAHNPCEASIALVQRG